MCALSELVPEGTQIRSCVHAIAAGVAALMRACVQSEYSRMFIKWKDFWGGEPSQEDVDKIYKRKEGAPTRSVQHADGTERDLWCTFSDEQIDINAFGDEGQKFIECELGELAQRCVPTQLLDNFIVLHFTCRASA